MVIWQDMPGDRSYAKRHGMYLPRTTQAATEEMCIEFADRPIVT